MATDEFPIGQILTAVSILEDKEFSSNELCLDKIQLFFQDTTVTLLPIADTDEIEIIQETASTHSAENTPSWCQSLLGKKLTTVWICENDRGYRDLVIFAFEYLHPSIAFVAECSVLNVFRYEAIYRVKSETQLQHSQVDAPSPTTS
ncbi:hypothetical protein H6S82_28795 [Planktothrix sp. FACHB-1355]|uniref:Uncharacterized protein n=1 Tax=Aerosakkonema funiforme FACHB-1375 TaxID=2949571 RepID=A0A926VEK9_9CYAN|nr:MULTISPECIES: DUF6334 family protein [Oscillatoriales]MBD2182506.1 hypothetical protein [Aerosakkonema funiforme FACHB-1375]MBD3562811.1 hypothetical protein [Planktothrix sp. FACHB-1355]